MILRDIAEIDPALRLALDALVSRLDGCPDASSRARMTNSLLTDLWAVEVDLMGHRLRALLSMRDAGATYAEISSATDMSKARVAQLVSSAEPIER